MSRKSEIFRRAKRIAVVRTDAIGDMVLTLPMCAAIRRARPDAHIAIIARRYVAPLLYKTPAADEIIYTDDYENGVRGIFEGNKFDAAFFPRPRFDEIRSAFSAGVPLRVGSGFRWYSVMLNKRVYDHRKKGLLHEAEYNVRLVRVAAGDDDLPLEVVAPVVNPESLERVRKTISEYNLTNGYIIVHPGSRGSARDWSAENFGKFSHLMFTLHQINTIITGTADEAAQCAAATAENPAAINLCGRFDLYEMIALISEARMLAANSTGVLHIASAMNRPVAGLYPNTSHIGVRRWGPLGARAVTICPPPDAADPDDMSQIRPKDVAAAASRLLV
ncbi:MAG: glycosyltransferase family 9 protein [Candidatus Kapaibacterium sp.]